MELERWARYGPKGARGGANGEASIVEVGLEVGKAIWQ